MSHKRGEDWKTQLFKIMNSIKNTFIIHRKSREKFLLSALIYMKDI